MYHILTLEIYVIYVYAHTYIHTYTLLHVLYNLELLKLAYIFQEG